MLISKTDDDDQHNGIINQNLPICPNCGSAKECIQEQVLSPASYIISLFCLLYCGIWCIFIIPLVFQSTKIIIKRCYYCNSELEKRNYFQLPNINDQVLQFRFGNCIIVVSRKYFMILLSIIFLLFFYFEYIVEKESKKIEFDLQTDKSWMDFLQFCGKFQFVENGLKARHQFETHFKNKIISWKGDYVQTKSNYDQNFPFNYWVYIKMDPTETTEDISDIALGVNSKLFPLEIFTKLQTGKPINFEAKFLLLGSEYNFHILELKQINIKDSEHVEDIKQIKKFTLIMDQTQQLKKTKLQDSLKRMIHMYEPKNNNNKSNLNQNNGFQMGLSAEEIQIIEQDIQQFHQKIESEEKEEKELEIDIKVEDKQSLIKNESIEKSLVNEQKPIETKSYEKEQNVQEQPQNESQIENNQIQNEIQKV
ncbi:unnamed protein product [Paramecium sonneborni]|uniref:LITAF domain-containing protein n=1 Tax=Paramecium sonneborni TaxID=65129 RepID=A0A8S1KGG2_9CILI|nr:unnamed protein product [Paramecium sonneborni]